MFCLAYTHTHTHSTLPKKLILQKRNLILKHLGFQAKKLIIPRPDPLLKLPKKKGKSYLNFVWIHLSLKICQSNLWWGWKQRYLSLLLDSLLYFYLLRKAYKAFLVNEALCCHSVWDLLCFIGGTQE